MAEAIDTVVAGIDTIQEGLEKHWTTLCHVESQQLSKADVETVIRHLTEVVDALQKLQAPAVVPVVRHWPWRTHASCYTLLAITIVLLAVAPRAWRPSQPAIAPPQVQQAVPQKGRK